MTAGEDGCPLAVDGRDIEALRESWLVEDRWWTDRPLRRRYWEVVTTSGRNEVVFHRDDPAGRELARSSPGRVVTFGFGAADITPELYASDRAGISMRLNGHDLRFPLIGRHNAENVLAAAAIIGGILPSEGAAVHLQNVRPLPGCIQSARSPSDRTDRRWRNSERWLARARSQ